MNALTGQPLLLELLPDGISYDIPSFGFTPFTFGAPYRPLVAPENESDYIVDRVAAIQLGKALGVSKPTVYEVFPSKQMLIDAVFKSAVDDVDYGWILRAADEKPALPVFLDQTAHGYKQLVSSARSVEAFSLLIREGGHSEELTAAFARYLSVPASTAARSYIAHLISSGQCVPLNVEVIQKMMTAPLFHAMLDRTLLRENSMSPALVEAYIDGSMSALKALLCTDNGATPLASRLRFREIS